MAHLDKRCLHLLHKGLFQWLKRGRAAKHRQHATEGGLAYHFDERIKGRVEIDFGDHRLQIKVQRAIHLFIEEAVDIGIGKKLLHHQIFDGGFEIFKTCGNHAGAIQSRHFFKQHMDGEPVGYRARKGKQPRVKGIVVRQKIADTHQCQRHYIGNKAFIHSVL
ncbi:Uncharacterised protein [Vibrio cholerae]|nr:Uncharacterised protein [Vibrio cholerae]CSB48578.1 Uncharacterised protein [Vibrio cholerae]CSB48835.1 Uncharacterised protein [Vibrio cholerae]CSB70908.1 Uncharacterised protein [Vibrio cholerae]CSB71564.1 Uncharacterised protein [Vibrio cholerae]